MRYYLGNCDFKWKHSTEHGNPDMEYMWVRRELGEKLAKEIEENNFEKSEQVDSAEEDSQIEESSE